MRSFLRLTWLVLPALVACGSIDDPNERKPLAVIEGQMLQAQNAPSVQVQSNVRIAVVWLGIDDRSLKSTQDVKAEAVFPSKFKLALTEPPPEDAMIRKDKRTKDSNDAPSVPGQPPQQSGGSAGSSGGNPDPQPPPPQPAPKMKTQSYKQWPADFGVAVGAVVAYEDLNGNGKLDLVDDNATQYVDRVLGINQELFLVYIEGQNVPQEMLPPNGSKPVQGFNLLQRIEKECPKTDDFCSPSLDVRWLPMSSLYDLPLSAEPRFGDIMCKGREGFGDSVSEASQLDTPGTYPAPNDPNLKCSPDGKSFTYEKCETIDRGLCKGTVSSCSGYSLSTTNPEPNWPCPVK